MRCRPAGSRPCRDGSELHFDPFDIARVAATALLSGEHAGQAYRLSGPESLLPAEQLRTLGELLGRDLVIDALSDADARADMEAAMPVEYVDAFFGFYVQGTIDESRVLPTVEDVAGTAPRSFREWAQRHLDAFR